MISFFETVPEYVRDGKHQEDLEAYSTLAKLLGPAIQSLMSEGETPTLFLKVYARQSMSSENEYAVYLFFTTKKIYSAYMKRSLTRKMTIESGIIEYPDIELKEKGILAFKKPYIVGKYRKVGDKPNKRRRITGLRLPNDADVTEVNRAMRAYDVAASDVGRTHSYSQSTTSPSELLQDLQKLHETGILSDEEFQQKKAEVLARV